MNGLDRCRELPVMALILAGLVSAGLGRPAAAGPAQALKLERKIALGEVRGRIDHLAVDLARERLFVAELGNDSLGVVDLAAGKLLRRVGGLDAPQGVAYDSATDTVYVYDSATDTVYVADGGDGLVHRFEGAELTPLDPIQLGGDADNVRLDPEAGRVVVGYGDGALALIEAATGRLEAQIRLPGHPESFQLEHDGQRAHSYDTAGDRPRACSGRPVPDTGVNEGGSLAGKRPSEASFTAASAGAGAWAYRGQPWVSFRVGLGHCWSGAQRGSVHSLVGI